MFHGRCLGRGAALFVWVFAPWADAGTVPSAEAIPAAGNAWHIALADVTGDHHAEVVYACYNGDVCCQRESTGELLWKYESRAFPYDLATGDIDGDNKAETLIASADGTLYVIGNDGKLRWKFTTPAPLYQVALARVDATPWVLAGGVDRRLYVLGPEGTPLKTLAQDHVIRLLDAGDLDGDDREEIVIASHGGKVQALGGPDLQALWRRRLRPIVDGRASKKGLWRPYSLSLDDLDGDGRCEVLLGSSFYDDCGIRLLNSDGSLRAYRSQGFTSRYDGTTLSQTILVAHDVDASRPGQEVIALTACRLFVFDQRGNPLTAAVSPVPFTDICTAGSKPSDARIYLASSPNGDDRIYRVRFRRGWERAFARLGREGKMARVTANIQTARRRILAYAGAPPTQEKYVHIVTGGQPDTPQRIRSHFGVIEFYRRQFPYDNCVFAMYIGVMADVAAAHGVAGLEKPNVKRPDRALSPAEIPSLLEVCEQAGMPFVVAVAHGCKAHIPLDTVRQILRKCPRYCLGFSAFENGDYGDRLDRFFRNYWYPLMDLCRAHGKKAFLVEKGAWWVSVPAMKRFRKLVDGAYAEVLVPSVEDSNSRSPELNLSGRVGLFLTGAVDAWSARTIRDELCWNRLWEWECPMTGHPFLRRQMVQALLGATMFEYELDSRDGGRFTPIGAESVELFIHMLGRGLLIPPRRADLVSMSPIAIRMREPTPGFLVEAFNSHKHARFAANPGERESPFEGLACYWGAAPVRSHYIGSYLFEQDRHALTLVPATPFGFPAILPAFIDKDRCAGIIGAWETDGTWFYDGARRLSGPQARPRVLANFEEAARRLPFQADGHAFMAAQRIGPGVYRVTLIDPGTLDPDDRHVVLSVRPERADPAASMVSGAKDLLSGEPLIVRDDNTIAVTVPAGAFRIIEVRLRRGG